LGVTGDMIVSVCYSGRLMSGVLIVYAGALEGWKVKNSPCT